MIALRNQTLIDSLFNISRFSNLQYLGLREYNVQVFVFELEVSSAISKNKQSRMQTKVVHKSSINKRKSWS